MVLGVDLWKRLSMFPGPCCLHPGEMTSDKGVHWAGVGSLVLETADNNFFFQHGKTQYRSLHQILKSAFSVTAAEVNKLLMGQHLWTLSVLLTPDEGIPMYHYWWPSQQSVSKGIAKVACFPLSSGFCDAYDFWVI